MNKMNELLKKCDMSDEMVNHIVSNYDHPERFFCDIVCGAPLSLSEKLDIISEYLVFYPGDEETSDAYIKIVAALAEIRDEDSFNNSSSMLYLFDEWYDTDVFIEKSSSVGMFNSHNAVFEYIHREDDMEKQDYESPEELEEEWPNSWYRIELWKKNAYGCMVNTYEYYVYDGEICWFNKMIAEKQDYGNIWYMPDKERFFPERFSYIDYISTPYSTGDIVKIDCRPFGPNFNALILEDQDQFDCCFPTIIFNIPYTDQWRCTSLKHRMFYKHAELAFHVSVLSPLYRIRKLNLTEIESVDDQLLQIKKSLGNDTNKAEKIWGSFGDEMSFDEMLQIVKNA